MSTYSVVVHEVDDVIIDGLFRLLLLLRRVLLAKSIAPVRPRVRAFAFEANLEVDADITFEFQDFEDHVLDFHHLGRHGHRVHGSVVRPMM